MTDPHECEGCGRVFPSVFELRRHQYGHDKGCMRDELVYDLRELFGNAKDDDGQPAQITIEEIQAMTDTLMSMAYQPHVHVVHPDGDVCLDCGERRPS